jgi:uncharacterized protein (TIGR02265 family)
MEDKLIFSQTIEGLFRAMAAEREVLRPQLVALGVDPRAPLRPAYPLPVFLEVVGLFGARLLPGATPEAQACEVGRRFISGYGETMVGRAMLGMTRLIGPRRTLERLSRQFRTGNNFSETKLTEVGPQRFELWCNQVTSPGWYRGLLLAGLEHSGARAVEVTFVGSDTEGGRFHISWR